MSLLQSISMKLQNYFIQNNITKGNYYILNYFSSNYNKYKVKIADLNILIRDNKNLLF